MNTFRQIKLIIPMMILIFGTAAFSHAQPSEEDLSRDSARSDKLTGGTIEKTALAAGNPEIRITLNVPSFQMTFWQDGKEVKMYYVGVGQKDYPIFLGEKKASQVIWNPDWIPPQSDWVLKSNNVKPGEIIPASDPRNPIGKIKIPLGSGYLIHQAKGTGDLGSLVSHGCVRVLKTDLLDLSDKIMVAYNYPASKKKVEASKKTQNKVTASLSKPLDVDITYDTLVVENGFLSIYPDVYEYETNTVANLRAELESNQIDTAHLSDRDLQRILGKATGRNKFVVSVENIKAGKETSGGRVVSVVPSGAKSATKTASKSTASRDPFRRN